ncbi:MAG: prolyl oligopeptidase family serine peptidase [Pseudomonadota bacterium]
MPRLFLFLAALMPAVAFAELRDEQFPVEAMLRAPFPSEIVTAADGAGVAFVLNEAGARNVWYAAGPDYATRPVTTYSADDGFALSDLHLVPGGERVVFVRGGAPNRSGELPNPASFTAGGEFALYTASLQAGAVRRLDDGAGPAVHPAGDRVAYIKKGAVWQIDITDEGAEAEKLFSVRGRVRDLSWSPDGERLLFSSDRGTHSFVGIWNSGDAAGELRWLSPSLDRDQSPIWSPSGSQVAFLRLPTRDLDRFPFGPVRSDLPWSIRIADVASLESHEIWRANEGRGSVHHRIEGGSQLFWANGDRLAFLWERNGWNQFYSVPVQGGDAIHLTPGNFEIEYAALTPDRRALVYASNQGDLHRRHLWRVAVAGGEPELLTHGEGIEWAPAPLANGDIALLRSGPRLPARPALLSENAGVRDLGSTIPATFPRTLVAPQAVEITATDGMKVPGQLFVPQGVKEGERLPVAIFLHGGSRRQMLLGWHMRGYYHNAYGMSQYLASRGVMALALNYRSGIGYGLEFREANAYGATGNSEFRDVLGAALYLRSREDVDPDRITVWGGSYGGYLTAHALAQASDLFAAGVDIHGVHDWSEGIRIFVPSYNKNNYPEEAELALQSSPNAYLDGWRSPVLLIHGDDDRNVFFSQTTRLSRDLRKRGVHVEQLALPDEVHGFLLHRNWVNAYKATSEFLLRHVFGD